MKHWLGNETAPGLHRGLAQIMGFGSYVAAAAEGFGDRRAAENPTTSSRRDDRAMSI